MRELTYYIGVSLDGFIAGPADEVDFYPVTPAFAETLGTELADVQPTFARAGRGGADAPVTRFDTVVMGRRTYEPALQVGVTDPYAHLRTVVFSSSLPDSRDGNVEIVRTDPVERVRELKAEAGLGIYLAGGAQLAGALIDEIDRLIVKKYPVIVGEGIPMARFAFAPVLFELEEARPFDNGCVVLTYRRARA
ncbi:MULTISPECIES: dihydrofolate reductase family protein [unclassified Microbacterium]|uniref:dihydrofolate reductase family protein n=1 Tax=unclassified Microbacterium TaxID=2609290 RepID=UPI001604A58E|nr:MULTISPECIES: dihydrofolate reductase family protein [unclassified Microbacterium]QNA93062.1 dihydrofolate reductase [Microbacterium sp. Se63.02b]QYM63240.1 dihydrofolate reductase family protein [Microbacterium sp. Se5.02b]